MSSTAFATSPIVTQSEMDQGRMFLEQSHTSIVGAIKDLSDAQWNFKPAPERWSIGEVVEHVLIVQGLMIGRVREVLPTAPAGDDDRDLTGVDAIVLGIFPHRFMRFNAPPFVQPTGRPRSLQAAVAALAENTSVLTGLLQSTPDLRCHVLEAAPLKAVTQGAHTVMDGYQWLLTAAAHTERHTHQILEVMVDANFPAD